MKYSPIFAPAVFAAAVLVSAQGFAQMGGPGQLRQRGLTGLVLGAPAADNSFVVVDSSGNKTTVKVNPATQFQINRVASSLPQTIKRGARVRISFDNDGVPATISSYGATGQLTAPQVKAFLAVTDAEWAELLPRIEKIQALQKEAADPTLAANNGFNNRFTNNNNNARASVPSQVQATEESLHNTYFAEDATPADLAASIKAFRAAKTQARSDLAAARKDLQSIVTPRQEALLVIGGILE